VPSSPKEKTTSKRKQLTKRKPKNNIKKLKREKL
jgi:hypothetical protein